MEHISMDPFPITMNIESRDSNDFLDGDMLDRQITTDTWEIVSGNINVGVTLTVCTGIIVIGEDGQVAFGHFPIPAYGHADQMMAKLPSIFNEGISRVKVFLGGDNPKNPEHQENRKKILEDLQKCGIQPSQIHQHWTNSYPGAVLISVNPQQRVVTYIKYPPNTVLQ